MANLSEGDTERIYFHLGVTDSIPDGDRIVFDDRLNNVSAKRVSYVKELLDALDKSHGELLALTTTSSQQLIAGDVNRSVTEFEASKRIANGRYAYQRRLLCEALGVIDFRAGGAAANWRVSNSVMVPRISSRDGTSVAARMFTVTRLI
jgi:hypothetical protein